jgi:hypothetical protein
MIAQHGTEFVQQEVFLWQNRWNLSQDELIV